MRYLWASEKILSFQARLMMKLEFFENAVFALKTRPVFSVHTTPEKFEMQQSAVILDLSLGKLGQGSHVIIVTSLFSENSVFEMFCEKPKDVQSPTKVLARLHTFPVSVKAIYQVTPLPPIQCCLS